MRQRAQHLGPEARRPLVLDAALPLFAREGYDAVSMQQIADAAEVSKPVLYSCFSSKEELFDALARREDRRLWELVESLTPPETATDPASALQQAFTGLFRAVAEAPDAIRVLYVEGYGENRIARGRSHWQQRMGEFVAERAPRFTSSEADVLGRLLVAAAELGFAVLLSGDGGWEPERLAGFLAPTLVHGIAGGARETA